MDGLMCSGAVLALVTIPDAVSWAYLVFAVVFVTGLAAVFICSDWQQARGLDKAALLGPVFFAASIAAFGTEHFTQTQGIASMVPEWIPWHYFWAFLVGACLIGAGLSLATRIEWRAAAGLLAALFFLFAALMDAPAWVHNPQNRFSAALMLRELSFSGGALALGAGLWKQKRLTTFARYLIAVPVLFYSFEQFRHGNYVPGIPLNRVTPTWLWGHALWTYLAAAVYAVAGMMLIAGTRTRAAATWLGLTVLLMELAVYVPIAVAERASMVGFNYMADTLMYCGAVLMLAGAMRKEEQKRGNVVPMRRADVAEV